jgi:hypothetical protein
MVYLVSGTTVIHHGKNIQLKVTGKGKMMKTHKGEVSVAVVVNH